MNAPMAACCWPSAIMRWSFKMGASAPFSRLLFLGGSRLHHWLPTPQKVPTCILRDEVPSLYPTMSSAFPMDVRQSVAGCTVRVIRRLGRFFEELRRTPSLQSSACPITPVLKDILCMPGYEPSILYIRQAAV